MTHLAVAGLQLELNAEDNLATIESEIDLVMQRFPFLQMLVLPELCAFGPSPDFTLDSPVKTEARMQAIAERHGIWLIPGSLFYRQQGKIYNTAPVINPQGEVIARFRKHYPFAPFERGVEYGDEFVVFDIPGVGRVGLMICFDMWHPEMARQLVWMGAEALIIPTLTNTIDRDVELAIARSTAAINQAWVVNINNAGRLGYGQSIVVGPDGGVVHKAGSGREIITVDLDFAKTRRVRERGMHGLVQTLKSFRDAATTYPCYQQGAGGGALDELGPLEVPKSETDSPIPQKNPLHKAS